MTNPETRATGERWEWQKVHNPENGTDLHWELWKDNGQEDIHVAEFYSEESLDQVLAALAATPNAAAEAVGWLREALIALKASRGMLQDLKLFVEDGRLAASIEHVETALNAIPASPAPETLCVCGHRVKDHGPTEDLPNYGDPAPCSECGCPALQIVAPEPASVLEAKAALADEMRRGLRGGIADWQARYDALLATKGETP
jgi:hypothetical protein